MIIDIKNFGPIKELRIDLDKDLHLLYGKNGIGKSYAADLLYCIFKNADVSDDLQFFSEPDNQQLTAKSLLETKLGSWDRKEPLDIQSELLQLIGQTIHTYFFAQVLDSLRNTFPNFKHLHNQYVESGFEINIHFDHEYDFELGIRQDVDGEVELSLNSIVFGAIHLFPTQSEFGAFDISFEKRNGHFITTNDTFVSVVFASKRVARTFIWGLRDQFSNIYLLPSSRSGLYQGLSSLAPILAELTQNRAFVKKSTIQLPALSQSVSDYFLNLSKIDKSQSTSGFEEIIKSIEDEVLSGEVDIDPDSKVVKFKPKGTQLELNLSQSSSMIGELSPLVLFLKHILVSSSESKGNLKTLLFIEEPEAHLHPEAQIALMNILAKLHTKGVKLFLTSHSDTMFHQLNNLILDKKLDPEIVAVYHMVMTPEGSVQDMEMVATKEGIIDNNFASVAEQQYADRLRILEEHAND